MDQSVPHSRPHLKDSLIDFIAGSAGGVSVVVVGQPLDTVKVKMQTFPTMYNGMIDCTIRTFKTEGFFRGLYAGTVPAISANVAENSVLFLSYGVCQKFIATLTGTEDVQQLSTLSNASAGCLGSFFSAFTLCPTELIKVKLQCAREVALTSGSPVQISAFELIRDIVKKNGPLGLFQGIQSTIAREMPGYFVFFGAYEGSRSLLTPEGKTKSECGPLATLVSGALGGVALWTVIYPIDLVKSRVQASTSKINVSLLKSMIEITRSEGITFLYSGLKPTLIRTIPASGAMFLCYEWTKKILHGLWS
ncbi:hypothetical protein V9T40_004525 [Parthenolecanium corni]|uniref:Mitochondrial ornithine transporter 1 n=1 Tax=Parthenolecanium corni TaxID=536013 RepID=A0AAN9TSW9_9HEMI